MGNCWGKPVIRRNEQTTTGNTADVTDHRDVQLEVENTEVQIFKGPLPPIPKKENPIPQKETTSSAPTNPVREVRTTILTAVFDYEARAEDDLTFKKGDCMKVISNSGNVDWWWVKHTRTGEEGYIPRNYVVVDTSSVKAQEWWCTVDRSGSERMLMNPELSRGTFLVREKEDAATPYVISVKDYSQSKKNYCVKHYKIRVKNDGRFCISSNNIFTTVPELIVFFSEVEDSGLCCLLKSPCPKSKPVVPPLREVSRRTIKLIKILSDDGFFGEVWFGRLNDAVDVAVKIIKDGKMSDDKFLKEAQTLHQLRHPKLVPVLGVCTKSRPIMIITEFMPKGDLLKYVQHDAGKSLTVKQLVEISAQIACGMSYLEKCNYIHRDLRASNILLGENNDVKIADFGLARLVISEDQSEDDTPFYHMSEGSKIPIKWTAPEALFHYRFSIKSDVWSFGILLYEIFTLGCPPYQGKRNRDLASLLQLGYRMPKPKVKTCPDAIYNIMLRCWQETPEDRPTFAFLHIYFDDFSVSAERSYN